MKSSIVTLNTLAHEFPTQSLESFRDLQGKFVQLIFFQKGMTKIWSKECHYFLKLISQIIQLFQTKIKGRGVILCGMIWLMKKCRSELLFLNGKFSPEALEFVTKCLIAKKNATKS